MTLASASLAQSPPLSVPARFFITAPVFGLLAAVVVLWAGDTGLKGRWAPGTLAVTHLLTLGYMGMTMLGALMQVFPVVIGHPFRNAGLVSRVVHACLTLGVLLLAAGFLFAFDATMLAAALFLGLAILVFLMAAGLTLTAVEVWGDTARTILLALVAFGVMTGFGLWLALGHGNAVTLSRHWTDIHSGWGLGGWVPLLLMGVAFQVVPMFQVTPDYPRVVRRVFPAALFAMLLLGTLAHGLALPSLMRSTQAFAGLILLAFAIVTLELQRRRRRNRPDVTVNYWRTGLVCLILSIGLWTAGQLLPSLQSDARFALSLGVLMIPGFSISVINGMLYKIVPFLVWLHLTMVRAAHGKASLGGTPGIRQIVPEKRARGQWRVHALGLVILGAGAVGVPWMLTAGAVVFAMACAMLWADIFSALRFYQNRTGHRGSKVALQRY